MRFLIHGNLNAAVRKALEKHEHAAHELGELELDEPPVGAEELVPLLEKRQWCLLTNDGALVREIYEKKLAFGGVVVQILEELKTARQVSDAIERLFERYKRLTPRRSYIVTASRVKIRQLPGGHA
jgi:hypothetical protein